MKMFTEKKKNENHTLITKTLITHNAAAMVNVYAGA